MRRKRLSSLDILSSKRAPRDYHKGKNCKPTGFHTRKGTLRRPQHPLLQQKLLKTRADHYATALVIAYVLQEGSAALQLCFPR
ncbi:hypothetical protein BAE44_0024636 [Dichanthelium oligosanthes]|uniref:Uncharacterized protein n=1 Tax=Dichanthelium oligosanthes TaxID=888268 RepID=A0A1E5UNH3_9POAL|nr:hypothetical protein BAE44_0024636 [Dichanthelium oligosanthes]